MTTLLVRFAKDVELKIKKENLYLNCVNTEDIYDAKILRIKRTRIIYWKKDYKQLSKNLSL